MYIRFPRPQIPFPIGHHQGHHCCVRIRAGEGPHGVSYSAFVPASASASASAITKGRSLINEELCQADATQHSVTSGLLAIISSETSTSTSTPKTPPDESSAHRRLHEARKAKLFPSGFLFSPSKRKRIISLALPSPESIPHPKPPSLSHESTCKLCVVAQRLASGLCTNLWDESSTFTTLQSRPPFKRIWRLPSITPKNQIRPHLDFFFSSSSSLVIFSPASLDYWLPFSAVRHRTASSLSALSLVPLNRAPDFHAKKAPPHRYSAPVVEER